MSVFIDKLIFYSWRVDYAKDQAWEDKHGDFLISPVQKNCLFNVLAFNGWLPKMEEIKGEKEVPAI